MRKPEESSDPIDRIAPGDDRPANVLDSASCYRALSIRDARFDGRFFTGVKTTGVFCRPVCPAPIPKSKNCTFWPSAASAQAAGFRPCLRCRPETAPGTPAWRGTAASVSRGMRLIEAGALDHGGSVDDLAERLGIGSRHLRRLFEQHLGATPRAVAKLRRTLFAKQLIDETSLSMTEIAASSGFSSQRRFNACIREVYGRPPSALRRKRKPKPRTPGTPGQEASTTMARRRSRTRSRETAKPKPGAAGLKSSSIPASDEKSMIELSLPYRPPFAWPALLDFFRDRAIPGVEVVTETRYLRTIRLASGMGSLAVRHDEERRRLRVAVRMSTSNGLIQISARLRQLFDLDADADAIDRVLAQRALLRAQVGRCPGMRVPGAFDGFETVVRAILGQQVSVKGATTVSGRVAERWGTKLPPRLAQCEQLERVFPTPRRLAQAPLEEVGIIRARAETIRGLARAVLADSSLLAPGRGLAQEIERWVALPGIGPWTAHYVAMRVLREPDALPAADLGLRKAISKAGEKPRPAGEVERVLEPCRPYRAYAAMRLWSSLHPA
jgi:AraC family transcriptional regulator of adaptative response / DNA-3-methyladenine glycosylase II